MFTDATHRYRQANLDVGREASILARALELAADVAGGPVSAEAALRATTNSARDGEDWLSAAATAARALGLEPHRRGDPPGWLPRDRPALLRSGPAQWMVATGHGGRRLRIVLLDERGETRTTMTPGQLRAATTGKAWLHVQPLLALDRIGVACDPRFARRPWLRLRAFMRLERRELWIVVVYALVVGALTLTTPVAVQALVNTVAFGSVLQPLLVLTLLLFGGLAFSGLLSLLEAYVVEVLQRRVFVRVAEDFGRRLPSLRMESLDELHGPQLANRFFEVVAIQKSMAALLLDGLALTLQTAIGMLLLGFYHPLLLSFDVVLVALLVVVVAAGRGAVATGVRESSAKYKAAAWLQDISRVVHLFRGSTAQQFADERTQMLCRDYLSARKSHFRILLRQIAGGVGLQIVAIVALLGVGGWLVINRQLTLGQLVAAELVIAAVGAGFVKVGKTLEKLYDLNVGVLKLGNVIDIPTERRGGEPLSGAGPAGLALREVTVTRGARALVSGGNLQVGLGERLRIAGPTGAGKSTLLDVLAGLRPPSAGSVHIDGVDLRQVDLGSARDAVVLARGATFVCRSVLDNVTMAGAGRTGERFVRELLRLVDLEGAIDRLPEGLASPLLPDGAPLSETQGRRLALVRALVGRPRALLLDRALDGLGLSASRKEALLDVVLGADAAWTAVVVTDDPDVAARCDRTVCLQDGRLEQTQ